MADQYLQVTTTTETEAEARDLARSVVEARLAACGQVLGPIHSTYWWGGGIETADEWMCLMKTTAGSCTVTPSMTGATLRLMNAVVTEVTTMSFCVPMLAGLPNLKVWIGQGSVRKEAARFRAGGSLATLSAPSLRTSRPRRYFSPR